MKALVWVMLCLSVTAHARARQRPLAAAKAPAPAATPAPATAVPVPAAPAEKPASALLPPEQQVERAERLFATLEYDQALPLARSALADPALSFELKVRALAVEGSTLAITADVADAERPFRKLLRLKPDFELPPKSPPKILAAFRKVQAEEKLLSDELEASRLKRTIAKLKLLDELPAAGKGGRPLKLSLRVFDPDGTVNGVKVPYRRSGETSWSVLALARDETGAWTGSIPGEVTASSDDYALETYVVTLDAKGGALLARGSESAPVKIDVAAGTPKKLKVPRGVFFGALALTAGSGIAAGTLGLLLVKEQSTYSQMYRPAMGTTEVDVTTYQSDKARGQLFAGATTAMLISTGVLAVFSLLFAYLVDWSE